MNISTKEIQAKLLKMLKDLHEICVDNDIQYIVTCGSALGAIRHSGFIPWDDDLDVAMLRKDAEKLEKIINTKYKDKYFYQSVFTDKNYNIPFHKIRLNNTTFIENGTINKNFHQGLFIDIFIFDCAPTDPKLQSKQLFEYKLFDAVIRNDNHSNLIAHYGLKLYMALFNRDNIINKLTQKSSQYNDKNTSLLNLYYDMGNKPNNILPLDMFFPPREVEFEGTKTFVANKVEDYLTFMYGDYMKLPPEEMRVGTHGAIVDLNKNYTEYLNYEHCE